MAGNIHFLYTQKSSFSFLFFLFFFFFFFFFFFLGPYLKHMEVPRLGWNWSCAAHDNARSLTHWARPGIEPTSSWMLVRWFPLSHNGNSRSPAFHLQSWGRGLEPTQEPIDCLEHKRWTMIITDWFTFYHSKKRPVDICPWEPETISPGIKTILPLSLYHLLTQHYH